MNTPEPDRCDVTDLYVSDCHHCRPPAVPAPVATRVARETKPRTPKPRAVAPKVQARVRHFQSDKTITRAVDAIRLAKPQWDEWPIREALKHAINGDFAGTGDPQTFLAYAVAIAAKPSVLSPSTLKWPEQWRWAAGL